MVHSYLFGDVKYLDLLLLAMAVDIVTGVLGAVKEKRLRSRTAWWGYARKIGVLSAIILTNVIDIILGINGALALMTVLFYLGNEGVSILENLSQLGVKVPSFIKDRFSFFINI
ncbi:holin [Bacillus sp. M6-12]|uniref:phage holin family protein n=1 Tax=Bacillus sp. M6-12 TaxID=2054166 RepID=UPI000C791962|nr:phage holin family protein [Bacillus sp. M6-12]PLS16770.1 holin [Bacillus sp. M6-12]